MGKTLAICLAVSLGSLLTALPATARGEGFDLDQRARVGDAIVYDNLTLYPIYAKEELKAKDYIVLDQGMDKGWVRVVETDGEGDVNQLTFENKSKKPLFLLAGEMIVGGKQDRIIGKNTIVAPRATETVPVFCVEHGRWSGRKAEFTSAGAMAHTELRKKANFSDQSEVWSEVSSKNAKRKLENGTDTYRGVAQSASVVKSIAGYQKAFAGKLGKLGDKERQIGFVVALGGKVVAIETFGSPKLFKKFEQKLLRSYYVEALDAARSPDGAPAVAPKPADVSSFARKAKAAKRKTVLEKKSGKTVQFEDKDMKGTAVEAEDGAPVYQGAYH